MMKLKRKWRNSRRRDEGDSDDKKHSLPTRDDFNPIDTREQEELIRSFESKHARQSLLWRGIFAAFLLCYVVFLIYSIYQQAMYPWELRYHAYFMEEVQSWMIIFADWIAVLACLLAVKGLLHDSSSYQRWMWYSCYSCLLLAVFWFFQMLRLPKFRWEIIWLPIGPLSGSGICLYVDHLLMESSEDIRKLRGCMYNYYKTR